MQIVLSGDPGNVINGGIINRQCVRHRLLTAVVRIARKHTFGQDNQIGTATTGLVHSVDDSF